MFLCLSPRPLLLLTLLAAGCAGDDSSSSSETDASTSLTSASATTTDATGVTDATTSGSASESSTTGDLTSTTTTTGGTDSTDSTSTGAETDSTTDDTTGGGAVPGALCDPIPSCDVPPPKLDGGATPTDNNHRGRDMFYVEGDEQWVLAKFADTGILDVDLKGETVQIFLLRGCEGEWEPLGSGVTTKDGIHPTIEGVDDTGGRLYFKIPADKALAPGRHRIHMIVESDKSTADQYIDVVPPGTPFFISDVDGTLTTYEEEEFWKLLTGSTPEINPFAAQAMQVLASKGYRPMYMTARPEFLYKRTREFVDVRGLPRGIIHTTLNKSGALGGEAVTYKTGELAMLAAKGLVPAYVFGNTDSDAEAYHNGGIQPLDHRVFFQFQDTFGGRTIQSYGELLEEFNALPDLCGR
jgi:hypothetical protein